MHHSRLCTIVIDCRVDDLKSATDFWSRAFGKPVESYDEDGDGQYARLATGADEPIILLQKVGHESRVHLDIETDDIEAQHRLLKRVSKLVDEGHIRTTLSEEFGTIDAANLKRAHALVESGRATGKVELSGF